MLTQTARSSFYIAFLALLPFVSFERSASAHGTGETPAPMLRGTPPPPPDPGSYVNFEIPHVHPLDINATATRLAACNTPDNRLEVFSLNSIDGTATLLASIPVGYAPVSARFRTATEVWVVNHISDTISVVDLNQSRVIRTIATGDEPADVVFVNDAGLGQTVAAVSCSRIDRIDIYSLTGTLLNGLVLDGEDPRALATNGTNIYAAIFESGNSSTIIRSQAVSFNGPNTPYLGQNPPRHLNVPGDGFNAGGVQIQRANLPAPPPPAPLILRKDAGNQWRDDNGENWTPFITGAGAAVTSRVAGWDLIDNDVASLTSSSGTPTPNAGFGTSGYLTRQMNLVMAIGVNPANGSVVSVGTDATNERRFEPNITGTFTRVFVSIANGTTGAQIALVDMNAQHLDAAQGGAGQAYEDGTVPTPARNQSIGDPRGIAFNPAGTRIYVSGMGSSNIVVLDAANGERLGSIGHTIDFGAGFFGPTGLAHHPTLDVLYCLNHFDASINVIDTTPVGTETVLQTRDFYDPTPAFINTGRVHLYDTHANSGLGQIACASCHIDARMDRLAWDLGNPAGALKDVTRVNPVANPGADQHNLLFGSEASFESFHPMKGPMTTQTLQDIIGKEPLHWRGDRNGIEQFAGAFDGLQGADVPLDSVRMQEFEDFLSTIHFPPNPFRPLDNSLPGGPRIVGGGNNPTMPMTGFVSTGLHSPLATPLPNGNPWAGFINYVNNPNDSVLRCVECHTLPIGAGSIQMTIAGPPLTSLAQFSVIGLGPLGESHQAMVSVDGTGQPHFKTPQLRNQIDKEGMFLNQGSANPDFLRSRAGFGVVHDGIGDGLVRFLSSSAFQTANEQELTDLVAFTLCIAGDGFADLLTLPGAPTGFIPPAAPDQTAHPAVGHQVMLDSSSEPPDLTTLLGVAATDRIDLVARGIESSQQRSWTHLSGSGAGALFQPDRRGAAPVTQAALLALAGVGTELVYTAVPEGSGTRMGIDRDEDGGFDQDETDFNSDSTNPNDHKFVDAAATAPTPTGKPDDPHATVNAAFTDVTPTAGRSGVLHIDAGDYADTGTFNKPVRLVAEIGTVRIGL